MDRIGLGEAVRGYLLGNEWLFGQALPAGVTPGLGARWAEYRFWLKVEYPVLAPLHDYALRLVNLPKRLMTPSWYPAKARYLYRRWRLSRVRHSPNG